MTCPGTNPKGYPITLLAHCPGCSGSDQSIAEQWEAANQTIHDLRNELMATRIRLKVAEQRLTNK